jgi:hypothetical protein
MLGVHRQSHRRYVAINLGPICLIINISALCTVWKLSRVCFDQRGANGMRPRLTPTIRWEFFPGNGCATVSFLSQPCLSLRNCATEKRLRPHPQHLPHVARHYRESLVDLRMISGPLLRMKDSRRAYLVCRLDVHPALILFGRLVF